MAEDGTLTNGVVANDTDVDGDTVTATVVAGPAHGTWSSTPTARSPTRPTANYNGTDSFTYKVNDGQPTSNTAR